MSLETEIKDAAKKLEDLLNLLPNEITVECSNLDVTESKDKHRVFHHQIVITSTHTAQIYP